ATGVCDRGTGGLIRLIRLLGLSASRLLGFSAPRHLGCFAEPPSRRAAELSKHVQARFRAALETGAEVLHPLLLGPVTLSRQPGLDQPVVAGIAGRLGRWVAGE